jgi:hypothetical protein
MCRGSREQLGAGEGRRDRRDPPDAVRAWQPHSGQPPADRFLAVRLGINVAG